MTVKGMYKGGYPVKQLEERTKHFLRAQDTFSVQVTIVNNKKHEYMLTCIPPCTSVSWSFVVLLINNNRRRR